MFIEEKTVVYWFKWNGSSWALCKLNISTVRRRRKNAGPFYCCFSSEKRNKSPNAWNSVFVFSVFVFVYVIISVYWVVTPLINSDMDHAVLSVPKLEHSVTGKSSLLFLLQKGLKGPVPIHQSRSRVLKGQCPSTHIKQNRKTLLDFCCFLFVMLEALVKCVSVLVEQQSEAETTSRDSSQQ